MSRSFSNGNANAVATGTGGSSLNHVPGVWDGITLNDPRVTMSATGA